MRMSPAMTTIISGGKQTMNNLDFRKFMVAPVAAGTPAEARRIGADIFQTMESVLKKLGRNTCISYEGGFTPNLASNEEGLALLVSVIRQAGYMPGQDVVLVIDVAASDFFTGSEYNFPGEGFLRTPAEMVEYYNRLADEYPLREIQNALADEDISGKALFGERLRGKTIFPEAACRQEASL